jgi:hypothetical protein
MANTMYRQSEKCNEMNKFILKHGYLVTFVILAILAWFVYRQFIVVRSPLFPFILVAGIIWALGTFGFICFWPRITYRAYKRAILQHGIDGPIPVNTLYAMPTLSSASASSSSLLATGTSDLLYIGGWLDLSKEPRVLHVPDFRERYYSIQFTDPSDGANFAYVGTRTTGTRAGDFLITGPGWKGTIPHGMMQISSPSNSVLVMGRALVVNDSDLAAAYNLSKQIQLTPLI